MICEPLEVNYCLFAKLLVFKWRFIINVQVTNMASSLQFTVGQNT